MRVDDPKNFCLLRKRGRWTGWCVWKAVVGEKEKRGGGWAGGGTERLLSGNWSSYLSSSWPYWTWRANQTSLLALLAFSVTCRSFSLLPQLHVPRTLGQPWRVLISVVWHAAIFFFFSTVSENDECLGSLSLSLSLSATPPLFHVSISIPLFLLSTPHLYFFFIIIIIPIICIFFLSSCTGLSIHHIIYFSVVVVTFVVLYLHPRDISLVTWRKCVVWNLNLTLSSCARNIFNDICWQCAVPYLLFHPLSFTCET